MAMTLVRSRLETAAKALAVACPFALILPKAPMGLILGLFVLAWLASGDFRAKLDRVRANPVALWAIALYALVALGMLYSSADWAIAFDWFRQYKELLYVPAVIALLYEPQWRVRAYYSYLTGTGLVVVLTFADAIGLWDRFDYPGTRNLFENHILFGTLVAPAVYLAAHEWMAARTVRWRILWIAYGLLATFALLFLNTGRVGYILFFALAVLFSVQRWRMRGLVVGLLLTVASIFALFQYSPNFKERILEAGQDLTVYQQGQHGTSVGLRLEFYRYTLELIGNHPFIGGGTGSYVHEYAAIAKREGFTMQHDNPHNEYLLLTTQLGIVGLAVFLLMLRSQWVHGYSLEPRFRYFAHGVILTMMLASLFDSMLQDSTVAKFYTLAIGTAFAGLRVAGVRQTVGEAARQPARIT